MKRRWTSAALTFASIPLLFGFAAPTYGSEPQYASRQFAAVGSPPPAVTCDVAPRPVAEMIALLRSPGVATPASLPSPLPPGKPTDSAITSDVAEVVREMESCLNAGDEYRLLALSSDAFFQQLPNTPDIVAQLEAMATETPTPAAAGSRQVLIGPWHVMLLDDGRVLAAVLFSGEDRPCLDLAHTKAVIFNHVRSEWRIESMNETIWLSGSDGPVRMIDVAGPPPTVLLGSQSTFCPDRSHGGERNKRRVQSATPSPERGQ